MAHVTLVVLAGLGIKSVAESLALCLRQWQRMASGSSDIGSVVGLSARLPQCDSCATARVHLTPSLPHYPSRPPLLRLFQAWYTIDQMSTYYTGNASAITSNRKALTNLLKYHIVEGKAIRASSLKDKQKLTMMNGETLTVHITDK
jgi:hypothetical protein